MNISVLKDVSASLSSSLNAAQITFVEDLVSGSLDDLAKRTGLDSKTCERLVQSACLHLAPPCIPLKELDESQTFLKTGIEQLDDALDGGLLTGTVTEVYGESSVGKTNFCLQLALMAQLSTIHGGLDSDAVILSTDHRFNYKRLQAMARHLFPNSVKDPLKRIHVQEVRDLDTQKRVLSYSLPAFMAQKKIRLVIVDSIGCNYRCEEQSGALRGRSMYDMGRSLKKLASDFNAVILVTNQVTDAFQEAPRQISISENRCESVTIDGEFLPGGKKPALGLMWSNFITTRIFLTKQQSTQECGVEGEDSSRGGPNRSLFIIFSSSVPCRDFPIAITNSGIQSLQ